jgi:hypothetical protein
VTRPRARICACACGRVLADTLKAMALDQRFAARSPLECVNVIVESRAKTMRKVLTLYTLSLYSTLYTLSILYSI